MSSTNSDETPTPPSAPVPSTPFEEDGQPLDRRDGRDYRRLAFSLLLSLLVHALLLSLLFGGQELGLPGFAFPWRERRIEVPDLQVVLVATHGTTAQSANTPVAGTSRMGSSERPVASTLEPPPFVSLPRPPAEKAAEIMPAARKAGDAGSKRNATTSAEPGQAPVRADGRGHAVPPPVSASAAINVKPSAAAPDAPATESVPTSVIVAPPSPLRPETVVLAEPGNDIAQGRSDPEPRERPLDAAEPASLQREPRQQAAARPDAAREEAARLERERQEAERQEAARLEASRREAERIEAEQREAERQQAARQEAARRDAEHIEAKRREAERLEAARRDTERAEAERREAEGHEAAREEAARQEAQRIEVRRREAERQEAARQEAARRDAERAEAEKREAERQKTARQEAARREAERAEVERREAERLEVARQEAARREAERIEAERREAERQKTARQEAARREAERAEAERREAERLEAARQEAARREAERVVAERREAERQEAARREAARMESERRETERQEAARQEAARVEAARQAAERQEAARLDAKQAETARREEVRRAIGRQLDEEAARREAASQAARTSSTLPLSLSTARRVRLWGRADPNAELIRYAEAWERKIHFNTPIETVRELAKRPHTDPMVTVAIRSNGSVESVTFVRSSGVAEVDEAIRRIVHSHENYPAFPPALALQFDVIEIRRTWHFDVAVRLY